MPFPLFGNNAASTLAVAVSSNTQATIEVQSGHGTRFPSPLAPDYFMLTLDDGTNVEVLKCIARSGDVLTCLRGYEGTTAQSSFSANVTKVEHRLTAASFDRYVDRGYWITGQLRAAVGVSSWHVFGMTLPTVLGTVAAATMNNSSWRASQARNRITSSNSATTPVHARNAQALASGQAGFRFQTRFGFAIPPTSSHFMIGLVNTTGVWASATPPSSVTNAILLGYVSSGLNSNLSIWHCDSAAGSTQLDLGSYFTVKTDAWYQFEVQVAPGDTNWYYTVRRLDISSIAAVSSYFSSDLPANSVWLSPYMHGVTLCLSAMAVEMGGWVIE